jgi:crossover junction endodeoxyribonuclease RuvC
VNRRAAAGRGRGAAPQALRVLGVDPGTRLMGWGVVDAQGTRLTAVAAGVLRASPRDPIELRLAALAQGLRAVIAEHLPAEAALEEVFFGRDAQAAVRIGEGRGAALLVLAQAGLPVGHYANNVVKKAVTGRGRATKERVLAMLVRLLGIPAAPETLDASDALALAVCHHQRRGAAQAGAGVTPRILEAIARARAEDAARKPTGI